MSDGPSHFKNEIIRLLTKALRVPYQFTLPYTPWSNGAVERLGKEVVRTFRALVSERRMDFKEWLDLLSVIQSVLNNAPSPHRRNIPPVTAFLSMDDTSPIGTFIRTTTSASITVSEAQRERSINVTELQKRISELHPLVQNSHQQNMQLSRLRASKGVLPNFALGDFVLVVREEFFAGEKLALRWRGPRRITQVLFDYVFQVKDLRNSTLQEAYGSRLKIYYDASWNTEAILSHVLFSETGMSEGRLLKVVEAEDGIFVLVCWKGLDKSEDSLKPLVTMYDDVPATVTNLLRYKNILPSLAKKARDKLRF